jgi:hypothetical protein
VGAVWFWLLAGGWRCGLEEGCTLPSPATSDITQRLLHTHCHHPQADSLMQFSRSVRPKNTLPLLTSTVKMDAEDAAVRCAFRWAGSVKCA